MTPKTRYFLVGAAALLLLGLAGGLIAYYGMPGIGAFSSEPAELVYVPANAAAVAFANVHEIMNSEVRQQLRQMRPARAASADVEVWRRFEEQTGITVETDVEHLLAYVVPATEREGQSDAVMLARGHFDQARVERLAEQQGGTLETYQGKRILVHRRNRSATGPSNPESPIPNPGKNSEMAVAFIQPGLVAVGTNAAVRRSLDLGSGQGSDMTTNDDFMRLIRDSDEGNVWAVGSFERINGHVPLPQNLMNNLPAVTYFAVTGQIASGVSGRLRAQTRDAQAVRNLSDVVRGFIAFGKLQTGARPELQTVLESLQLQSEDNAVTVSFALPSSALQALAQRQPERKGQ